MNDAFGRSREMAFREFEQLLNLFFPANMNLGPPLWQKKPFQQALRSFLRDSVVLVSPKDLTAHAEKNWLPKRRLTLTGEALRSFHELGSAIRTMRI